MKSLKIEAGDLVVDDHGSLVLIEDKPEEMQCIDRILTTGKGEWFLNALHGLDFTHIFVKPFDEERARLAIVEAIHQEPRVENVEEIEFRLNRPGRHMDMYVRAKMTSGNIVEGVIPIE